MAIFNPISNEFLRLNNVSYNRGPREALFSQSTDDGKRNRAGVVVFFEQGYAATSLDSIIERIGGSKRNIYSEFGSKEGVFTALVSESADAALAPLSVERFAGRSLSEILLEFGRRLLAIHMSPALIGVYRSIMTEALRFPELAKAFYDKGPGRASDRLAEVLEEAKPLMSRSSTQS